MFIPDFCNLLWINNSNAKVHKRKFICPELQRKMFTYMNKKGKDFLGKVTSLFPYMLSLVQNQSEGAVLPPVTQPTPTLLDASSS